MARSSRSIHALIAAVMVVLVVVGASTAVSAAPAAATVGPPDAPLTQVTTSVATNCGTFPITATVPTYVNAGRPFRVTLTAPGLTSGPNGVVTALLTIAGGTKTSANVSFGNTAYFVAAWSSPEPEFRLSITGFDAFDATDILEQFCAVDSPVELAAIPVLHNTPFSAANITATQQYGFYCIAHPTGTLQQIGVSAISVTTPNQAHQGEPFTVSGPASVTGGVRSGNTVTPTGKVGDTVDFWYDSSYVVFAPPPFPPVPVLVCTQLDGPVHLASVPIVAR